MWVEIPSSVFLILAIYPHAAQAQQTRLDAGLLVTEATALPSRSSFRHGAFVEGSRDDRLGIQVAALLRDWMFGPSIHENNDPRFRLQAWYSLKHGEKTGGLGFRAHVSYDLPWIDSWQTRTPDEVLQHEFQRNWLRGTLQTRWYGDRSGKWRWVPAVELGVSRYTNKIRSPHLVASDRTDTEAWAGVRLNAAYTHRFFVEAVLAAHGTSQYLEGFGQISAGLRVF